jgi:hypothetical protein
MNVVHDNSCRVPVTAESKFQPVPDAMQCMLFMSLTLQRHHYRNLKQNAQRDRPTDGTEGVRLSCFGRGKENGRKSSTTNSRCRVQVRV